MIPGSAGIVPDEDAAKKIARRDGLPVMIKAAEGGGGRGMRMVRTKRELIPAFQTARTEAEQAFGSPNVYMEKLIERPRHIEFQVLGDKHGNVIHLGERECSLQRRHQKVLEESPSTGSRTGNARTYWQSGRGSASQRSVTPEPGTVEFLRDVSGNLYFIEMNARIQVEHPVTEMVTRVDLVKAQIRIAAGEKLEEAVGPFGVSGHAIECRINAEDPETFVPSPGHITAFRVPGGPGIRVDTAAYADAVIPPYYDSLIAKLIAHGRDRAGSNRAHARRARRVRGRGHQDHDPACKSAFSLTPSLSPGQFDTHFLERLLGAGRSSVKWKIQWASPPRYRSSRTRRRRARSRNACSPPSRMSHTALRIFASSSPPAT